MQGASGGGDPGGPRGGLLLSGVAGSVDGLGFVLLGVFTAHVTGNTVHLGTDLGMGRLAAALRAGAGVALFAAGVALGAVVRDACGRRGLAARPAVHGLAAALLLGFWALGRGAGLAARPEGWRFYGMLAFAAMAMGSQNAVAPKVGDRRVRTYLTGVLTELAEDLVEAAAGGPRPRRAALGAAGWRLAIWLAYLAGGVVSGAAALRAGAAGALVPVAGLLVTAAAARRDPPG